MSGVIVPVTGVRFARSELCAAEVVVGCCTVGSGTPPPVRIRTTSERSPAPYAAVIRAPGRVAVIRRSIGLSTELALELPAEAAEAGCTTMAPTTGAEVCVPHAWSLDGLPR
jgi:hypothetical protein